jgi:hypothetical protein
MNNMNEVKEVTKNKKPRGRPKKKTEYEEEVEKELILKGELCPRCKRATTTDDYMKNNRKFKTCENCREITRRYAQKVKDVVNEKRRARNWGRQKPKKIKKKIKKVFVKEASEEIMRYLAEKFCEDTENLQLNEKYQDKFEKIREYYKLKQ